MSSTTILRRSLMNYYDKYVVGKEVPHPNKTLRYEENLARWREMHGDKPFYYYKRDYTNITTEPPKLPPVEEQVAWLNKFLSNKDNVCLLEEDLVLNRLGIFLVAPATQAKPHQITWLAWAFRKFNPQYHYQGTLNEES